MGLDRRRCIRPTPIAQYLTSAEHCELSGRNDRKALQTAGVLRHAIVATYRVDFVFGAFVC
jgi:hypothetical protein